MSAYGYTPIESEAERIWSGVDEWMSGAPLANCYAFWLVTMMQLRVLFGRQFGRRGLRFGKKIGENQLLSEKVSVGWARDRDRNNKALIGRCGQIQLGHLSRTSGGCLVKDTSVMPKVKREVIDRHQLKIRKCGVET